MSAFGRFGSNSVIICFFQICGKWFQVSYRVIRGGHIKVFPFVFKKAISQHALKMVVLSGVDQAFTIGLSINGTDMQTAKACNKRNTAIGICTKPGNRGKLRIIKDLSTDLRIWDRTSVQICYMDGDPFGVGISGKLVQHQIHIIHTDHILILWRNLVKPAGTDHHGS